MPRYFIRLSYKGTRYHGWQYQNNALTVQEVVNNALSLLLRKTIAVTGAGRTDTGVHALDFYAHFDDNQCYDKVFLEQIVFRLNSFLPNDVSVKEIFPVQPGAHARFSAISRTYKYYISTCKNPFRKEFSYYLYGKINVPLMNRGSEMLMGKHDFSSFSKADTDVTTNICSISFATWTTEDAELVFTITADRFLRNMVRAIVGTLLELGTGKITLEDFKQIFERRNRSNAGESVPACGLWLHHIEYPADINLFTHPNPSL